MANEVTGIGRDGAILSGWLFVQEQIATILTQPFFERVMRPYVGTNAWRLIGELANRQTAQRFRWAVALAVELFVPNFKLVRIDWVDVSRSGDTGWRIDGTYYPRGHLGDYSNGARYTLDLAADVLNGTNSG